jgi:hypothetical protein
MGGTEPWESTQTRSSWLPPGQSVRLKKQVPSNAPHPEWIPSGKKVSPWMRASTAFSNLKERSNFETKPCAPANFDSARVSLSPLVENKSTGMLGNTLLISLVALKPSRNGITTSKMIKSGFSRSAFSIRSSPFDASPQTFRFGRDCSLERTAARIPGWSSAISIWQECRKPL